MCRNILLNFLFWRVSSLESEHSTTMSSVMATMKTESEQKLTAAVQAAKEDEKNHFSKEIEEMKQLLEQDKAQAVAEAVTSIQEQLKLLQDVSFVGGSCVAS